MPRRTPDRQRIADDIRARIIAGQYPPGSKLPTIRQLADTYRVSEEPVRTALRNLSVEGWIETQQGKGSFVVEELPPTPPADPN
jgi:DNA-binding GntR family transcriptional regulator